MRHFDYEGEGNEEYREDVDNFFQNMINSGDAGDLEDFEKEYTISREEELMDFTLRVLEKSFFWNFYSVEKKMESIKKVRV